LTGPGKALIANWPGV